MGLWCLNKRQEWEIHQAVVWTDTYRLRPGDTESSARRQALGMAAQHICTCLEVV